MVAAATEDVDVGVNVLAIIPARAGSTRIPRKNMAMLCGRPMLAWTLDAAIDAIGAQSVVLSTDDDEAAALATARGVRVRTRPADLCGDHVPMAPVIDDALADADANGVGADVILLLQPTSPLRGADRITEAVAAIVDGAPAVVSVCADRHAERGGFVGIDGHYYQTSADRRRTQDIRAHRENGAIYGWRRGAWAESHEIIPRYGLTHALVMDLHESVDVDLPDEMIVAEALMRARGYAYGASGDAVEIYERFVRGERVADLGGDGAEAALRHECGERTAIISEAFRLLRALGDGLSVEVASALQSCAGPGDLYARGYRLGVAHGKAQAETATGHVINALYGRAMP